jgi:hypothetical protein
LSFEETPAPVASETPAAPAEDNFSFDLWNSPVEQIETLPETNEVVTTWNFDFNGANVKTTQEILKDALSWFETRKKTIDIEIRDTEAEVKNLKIQIFDLEKEVWARNVKIQKLKDEKIALVKDEATIKRMLEWTKAATKPVAKTRTKAKK